MGKPKAIRNRKNEMISCWICALFVMILYVVKGFLLGFGTGSIDVALWVLCAVWVVISIVYAVIWIKHRDNV